MTRMINKLQDRPGPRVRLKRIRRSCLYRQPDRRARSGARREAPGVQRRHCRYSLQTSPPPFRQRKR